MALKHTPGVWYTEAIKRIAEHDEILAGHINRNHGLVGDKTSEKILAMLDETKEAGYDPKPLAQVIEGALDVTAKDHRPALRAAASLGKVFEAMQDSGFRENLPKLAFGLADSIRRDIGVCTPGDIEQIAPFLEATAKAGHDPARIFGRIEIEMGRRILGQEDIPPKLEFALPYLEATAKAGHDPSRLCDVLTSIEPGKRGYGKVHKDFAKIARDALESPFGAKYPASMEAVLNWVWQDRGKGKNFKRKLDKLQGIFKSVAEVTDDPYDVVHAVDEVRKRISNRIPGKTMLYAEHLAYLRRGGSRMSSGSAVNDILHLSRKYRISPARVMSQQKALVDAGLHPYAQCVELLYKSPSGIRRSVIEHLTSHKETNEPKTLADHALTIVDKTRLSIPSIIKSRQEFIDKGIPFDPSCTRLFCAARAKMRPRVLRHLADPGEFKAGELAEQVLVAAKAGIKIGDLIKYQRRFINENHFPTARAMQDYHKLASKKKKK